MKRVSTKLLMQIFWSFLKIGPVTFGGGYAMIPLIEREVVHKRKWVKTKDITDIFALAESVPGAIAINSATFIGHRIGGVFGAIVAMIGVLLPTFCIVLALCILFIALKGNPHMEAAFIGIRAAIVALIIYAAIKIGKIAVFDRITLLLTVITVILLLLFSIHPVLIIVSGALLGVFLTKWKKQSQRKK